MVKKLCIKLTFLDCRAMSFQVNSLTMKNTYLNLCRAKNLTYELYQYLKLPWVWNFLLIPMLPYKQKTPANQYNKRKITKERVFYFSFQSLMKTCSMTPPFINHSQHFQITSFLNYLNIVICLCHNNLDFFTECQQQLS